jgi:hypothetical protein
MEVEEVKEVKEKISPVRLCPEGFSVPVLPQPLPHPLLPFFGVRIQ